MHEVVVESRSRLIRFSVSGMLDKAEFESFDSSLRNHVRELSPDGGSFDILADLRGRLVVPQPQSELISAQMKWLVGAGLRRSANILASSLLAMQMRRIANDERSAYFTSEADALRWLEI